MAVRNRIFLLILIMTLVSLIVGGIAIVLMYRAALEENRARLVETVQSQARLIEAMARFDTTYHQDYPVGAAEATLSQIRAAHERYAGFGETGEFTLARLDGDQMVFLLEHRHLDLDVPAPIPFDSDVAEPMRRALSGQSGTVMGLDYRGVRVLAAYEPVAVLDLGIVAKIDLAEIRAPFVKAGLIAGMAAVLIAALGIALFLRIGGPMQTQLVESEARYRTLYEMIDEGFCVIEMLYDPNGTAVDYRFLEINQAFMKQTGLTDALTKTMREMVPAHDAYWFEIYGKVAQTGEAIRFENPATAMGRYYEMYAFRIGGDGSHRVGILFNDITERKQAEMNLQENEQRLRLFFDNTQDLISLTDENARTLWANTAWQKVFGTDLENQDDTLSLIHPDDLEKVSQAWNAMTAEGAELKNLIYRFRLPEGTYGYFDSSAFPILLKGEKQYYVIARDITELVQAEQRMRELTRQLITAQESERKHIAQELHDELGQALTAISLDLGRIEQALPPDTGPSLKKMVKEARTLTDEVDERVSELALELRPSLLDDLGLAPTLEWYVDQYSQRLGVAVAMEIKGLEKRLPPEMETGLYRIIQEALTNVARHAQAHSISLHLERSSGMVTVNIADDGRGFDFEKAQGSAGSTGGVGLLGMKERASALGGRFEVHSKPGQGTRIHVEIPL